LEKLTEIVDLHWAEICDSLPTIEALSEDESFEANTLAASVASKCFYHLQEYDDALRLALCSGPYFDISKSGDEYIEKLLAICIDKYTEECRSKSDDDSAQIDPKKEAVIEQMYKRCYRDFCCEQAIGIALNTKRIDKVHEVCKFALDNGKESLLDYTFALCQNSRVVNSRSFRLATIDVLVGYYGKLSSPDYRNVCFGLQYLNRPADVANKLVELCKASIDTALQAYQIAFDMQEAENQGFVIEVVKALPAVGNSTNDNAEEAKAEAESEDEEFSERMGKLRRVLIESFDVDLTLNFLFRQSKTDLSILEKIKTVTENQNRGSSLHNATIVSHAYMNAGTTHDTFIRENLPWLKKATNWAKFTAVSSMGVVHKGNTRESMNLLQPYLSSSAGAGPDDAGYAYAGALYALGLIHVNKGGAGDSQTIAYLRDALNNATQRTVVQHGACLGIGLAAMATGDNDMHQNMFNILHASNDAIAGEGAALAIGLIHLGKFESPVVQESITQLLHHVHQSSHEKIIRGISLSLAMFVYGQEQAAEVLIEQLSRDRDPIIRYGGMFATAMAYCGTADNGAVRRLLHVAVSDVSDDVRRAAVSCLGFVMFRSYETLPNLVALLAESFNPHIRYGACMAVGVACAGTAFKDAIDLLMPMMEDQVDFVRQGAMMALSMVLMQTSEARSPSVKKLSEHLMKVIHDKHQPMVSKIGAILGMGISEAGGRNVTISMQSRAGFLRGGAVVGLMLWLQHWYWYPLMHTISLSFSPTMMIGLNKDFNMAIDFKITCKAPPSMFAYPKPEEKKDDKKLKATAVLSTTARASARQARKEARKAGVGSPPKPGTPGGDDPFAPVPLERQLSNASYISTVSIDPGADIELKSPKKEKEPSSFSVANLDRVMPAQARFLFLQETARYTPVACGGRDNFGVMGIIMLTDNCPDQAENVRPVERITPGMADEADMPEPFEWDPEE